jgi:hypothetical protein
MPMSFQEYCKWHFNSCRLEDIFGLSIKEVLPEMHEMVTYAIDVEKYHHDDLYILCLDKWEDVSILHSVVNQLGLDISFPNIRETSKTICRWIISQENLIAKNLEPQQRDILVSRWEDYSYLESPFNTLTGVWLTFMEDNKEVIIAEKSYYYFFDLLNSNDSDQREVIKKEFNIAEEYDEIFQILINFKYDNYTIKEWIAAEDRIVQLSKIVYEK